MSKTTHQAIVTDKNKGYFSQIENVVILGEVMTLIERAVYMHYKALAWKGAYKWWQKARNENPFAADVIARVQGISKGAVSKARKSLAANGFISLGKISRTKAGKSESRFFYEVTILDIAKMNLDWCLGSPDEPKEENQGFCGEPKSNLRFTTEPLRVILGSPGDQSLKELREELKKDDCCAANAAPAKPDSLPLGNPTPKTKKGRRPKVEQDPLLSNPNVTAYREILAMWPNMTQRKAIAESVTDSVLWKSVVTDWTMRGWSKMNVAGMLDVYRKGGASNGNAMPARAAPSRSQPVDSGYNPNVKAAARLAEECA